MQFLLCNKNICSDAANSWNDWEGCFSVCVTIRVLTSLSICYKTNPGAKVIIGWNQWWHLHLGSFSTKITPGIGWVMDGGTDFSVVEQLATEKKRWETKHLFGDWVLIWNWCLSNLHVSWSSLFETGQQKAVQLLTKPCKRRHRRKLSQIPSNFSW
jgi:hypothetical protein